ncbi:nuclear factor of activated T-cells 5 isoform X1 [Scleropages formosus]|uniref:nuclear factor of activated T-cells 5 isoform X1 n=2 Tax=Scleropages formosus TaxID=113540 RepID=UPI000878BD6D|nr:nuclear factor of activated T-cells 5 isoform X1 [Scleropages formosus]XP_018608194.1 nuclear factor of activated T-cells 5 isoform X1 [Scleropages formosus]
MPSDFISLLGADLDLNSPKSLYSKESVYDLLPKELQLPSSSERDPITMSQKSGGEAGPPPPAALASDATSSSMPMGGPRSAFPASSSPTIHSSTSVTDRASVHNSCAPGDVVSSRGVVEMLGMEGQSAGAGTAGGGGSSGGTGSAVGGSSRASGTGGASNAGAGVSAQHQTTPSKRRTVLNISPPPEDLLDDSRMSCQEDLLPDSEQSSSIWMEDSASNFSLMSSSSYNDNTEVPRKSRKRTTRQRPGPKPVPAEEASMDVFDADSAKGPHFVLSQLGPDSKPCASSTEGPKSSNQKGGTLSGQYPSKAEGKELKILVQPETQHRARYLTEGSRGSVKDRTQQGFPTVKLEGMNEPVVLQVFVGNDTGRVKPHGFYQACRVTGRNTTACKEVDIEGTTVIEVCLDPSSNMTLAVDCVGILKLRNADVEARIGVAGSKKKSTRARLVFRVNIPRSDGSMFTLQAPSSPILCTQPAGVPEILKKSLHSCPAVGGQEVFLIGKNFLKGTKVIFQENASDENSWKAEAEIDMELFHQNHLIVKVPPYQNLAISTPVSVGIYVVTNAGRSHDIQPFTYTPEPVKAADMPVKKETSSPAKPCSFKEQMKVIQSGNCTLENTLMAPMMPLVKREEATPMEVSTNISEAAAFKTSDAITAEQQAMDVRSSIPINSGSFSGTMTHQQGEPDQQQSTVYTGTESMGTIQKQDITAGGSFPVSGESLLQQVSQPFLLEAGDGLSREGAGGSVVGLAQIVEVQQAQAQQPQLSIFPQDGVAQLERAVRHLQAGGFSAGGSASDSLVQQVLEVAAQQQLNSVLYSPAPSTESVQQQVQDTMTGLQLQPSSGQLAKPQQQQEQHQQQVLENLQQLQSELFQPQISMQCSIFQGTSQNETSEQQNSPQPMVQGHNSLFQSPEDLMSSASQQQRQQQQQVALFQQAGELLSIQTSSFLQQTPSHPSPTQQLFHTPSPLPDGQDPQRSLFHSPKGQPTQEQVQAALFQNTLTVLTGSSLSQEQQPAASSLFLSQSALPGQLTADTNQQQQQQLAFLTSMQASPGEPQSVSVFQSQPQLAGLQQSTPMEQQQSPQQPQSSLFQSLSPHAPGGTLSPSQQQQQAAQQQQAGLLYCSNSLNPPEQPPALLFSNQAQLSSRSLGSQESQNSSLLFPQSLSQQEPSEPMSFQDQSSVVETQSPVEPPKQGLFQDPQPMQLVSASGSGAEQPITIFMPQATMTALQGGVGSQELPQASIFATQNGSLQTTSSSPVQQPGSLFQTAVSSAISQEQQPGMFLFSIQNECGQLMDSPGPMLSEQLIALSQSGQGQRENDAQIQSLLNQTMSESGNMQNSMTTSQNMEKIDDLLVSLQEQGNNLSRSY